MFLSLIKGINRLISKGMSNIFLKVTIGKKWRSQNFDFLSLKNWLQVSFYGATTYADIIGFSNFLLQLKSVRGLEQNCV